MLSTLKAVVQGDKIHWQEAVDTVLPANRAVEVLITVLEGRPHRLSPEDQVQRRVAALQKLVALKAFSDLSDPVRWQRETREDRELPGRETGSSSIATLSSTRASRVTSFFKRSSALLRRAFPL